MNKDKAKGVYDKVVNYVQIVHNLLESDTFDETTQNKILQIDNNIRVLIAILDQYLTGSSEERKHDSPDFDIATIYYLSDGGYSRFVVDYDRNTAGLDTWNAGTTALLRWNAIKG